MSEERRSFWNPEQRKAYLEAARGKTDALRRHKAGEPVAEEFSRLWESLASPDRQILLAMSVLGRRSFIALHDHVSLRPLVGAGLLKYPQGQGGNWMRAARTSYEVPQAIWEKLVEPGSVAKTETTLSVEEAGQILDAVTGKDTVQEELNMSSGDLRVFKPSTTSLQLEKVLRIAGYKDLDRVRPKARYLAEAMILLAEDAIVPRAFSKQAAIIARDGDVIRLGDGTELSTPVFTKFLDGCDDVIVAVITLGAEFDAREAELSGLGQITETLFLQSAGRLAIENLTKQFIGHLRDEAKRHGQDITRRLAPGYSYRVGGEKCLWRIEDQRPLFALFDGHDLPVDILESCALVPKMTRTALFGVTQK